jgi:hypothetical protein
VAQEKSIKPYPENLQKSKSHICLRRRHGHRFDEVSSSSGTTEKTQKGHQQIRIQDFIQENAMTATTVTQNDANAIAKMIAKRTAVPANADIHTVREGISIILLKAGKALSPNTPKATQILTLLAKIDDLLSIESGLIPTWIAIRAMAIKSGTQAGVSAEIFENPIAITLMTAAGIIPTTDPESDVRAHLGELEARSLETVTSNGRIVKITPSGEIEVSNGTGQILSVNVASDPVAAVTAVDSKAATSITQTTKIGPITYNCVDAAELAEFAPTVFSNYKVRRFEIPGAQAHPTDLVESSALSSVLPPEPSYAPHFHPEIIQKGLLSDVQLETVIYAGEAHTKYLAAHPDDKNSAAPRQGFLVGHGTGVGKGRITAGIFADNWAQGRRRGLWFSESAQLIEDARRDWKDLGGNPKDIVDIRSLSSDSPIEPFSGIIFATYAALRSENQTGSRLRQLIEWFGPSEDGVIAFDEAQNLRNSRAKNDSAWSNKISRQGQAAADLQNSTPNARVVYISATSASDISSLGFATRLGLWGSSTSFTSADTFFKAINHGGTNALEMVSRDLKAMGLYLAANLSFEGVTYERMDRALSPEERDAHDTLSDIWVKVGLGLRSALITTGISSIPAASMTRSSRMSTINYGMTRARFFQASLASLKTPMLIDAIREDLKNGHAPVIQILNTFAANADRAIQKTLDQGGSIDDVEATPRDILLGYMEKYFPVTKYTTQGNGKFSTAVPAMDAQGNPVFCAQAQALRDQLIAEVNATALPEGPLEQLLDAFGPDMIAEATGRSQRLVPNPQGGRSLEERTSKDMSNDVKAFMDDNKRILVFSAAGATGATYSASRTSRNQRLRRHYVLQPGWRADQALQGMGRTNRSNQAQPPQYILLTTDLWSDQRMISAVATGMRDLGALTRGLRQAASQDFFTQDDNLEDEFGESAWHSFVHKLAKNAISGLSIGQFEREAGILLRARQGGALISPIPPVKRFLNSMSAMSYGNQMLFGRHYRSLLQDLKLEAIENGQFDRGVETITPDSLIKLEDAVIYRDPRTGGETRMLKMLRIDELEPVDYAEALRMAMRKGNTRVMKSLITGRIAMLSYPRSLRGRIPSSDDLVEVITPTGARTRTRSEVMREGWTTVAVTMAEKLWNAELNERGDEEEQTFSVISGAMLPIWNKLPRSLPTVYRMETDEGEQIIGRLVSEKFVDKLLRRVDAINGGGLSKEEVNDAIGADGVVTLVNGWTISGRTSKFTGKKSFTLLMPIEDEQDYIALITQSGLTKTIGMMRSQAYFRLPLAEVDRLATIHEVLKEAPAVTAAVM